MALTREQNRNLMRHGGQARFRARVEHNQRHHRESGSGYGQRLLQGTIPEFSAAIAQWLKESRRKNSAGSGHACAAKLRLLKPDMLAFLAAKVILDAVSTKQSYGRVCNAVGDLVEDEVRWNFIAKRAPREWAILRKKCNEISAYHRKKQVLVAVFNRGDLPEVRKDWTPWSHSERVNVGTTLVHLFIQSTGLVETVTEGHRKSDKYLAPLPGTLDWIRGFNSSRELMFPLWLPLVEPPDDWEGPWGGIEGVTVAPFPMVKTRDKGYLRELPGPSAMPEVYEAVNRLQRTAWRVNQQVLEVVETLWSAGQAMAGLVSRTEDIPLPDRPQDIEENEVARKEWRKVARDIYRENITLRSERMAVEKTLVVARQFRHNPEFFFPYQLDFRGRTYAVAGYLQPQGCDLARGLLEFAHGKPILHEHELKWLAVHGANCWGYDKVSFEDREKWVGHHEGDIILSAQDPLDYNWWMQADKPFQFLAFCFEWERFLRDSWGTVCSLPVSLDGSNNGLQILSLLMRDEVGGRATNCLPGDTPADIYQDVADATIADLNREIDEGGPEASFAAYWLAFGITRTTVKRPVMILPYGGSFNACMRYLQEWFQGELKERGQRVREVEHAYKLLAFLSKRVWAGINSMVGKPQEFMAWLQECAGMFGERQPILWTTPTGFPVKQAYERDAVKSIETRLGDRIKIRVPDSQGRLDTKRQRNGISPNFVHSLDAAALHRATCLAGRAGVKSFAMIHDSYGALPSDIDILAGACRAAFVSLFREPLVDFLRLDLASLAGGDMPSPPSPGNMDPESVQQSEYFFA